MTVAVRSETGILAQMNQYVDDVLSGRQVAGRLVRLACERHVRDLELGSLRGLWFDEDAAAHAVQFFGYCRHIKGEWANQPVTLDPWQVFIVGSLFGWKREDGTAPLPACVPERGTQERQEPHGRWHRAVHDLLR
jgi:hypothetical protein